jgi:sulfate permease, SulP family
VHERLSRRLTLAVPEWLRSYRRDLLPGDLVAALVVAALLVPQGMAYAALAGLPPHIGLYASVLPVIAYALAGSSKVLAVGPVAVVALLTAASLQGVAAPGSAEYVLAAALLALLSGVLLFSFGLLRLGAMAHLLSHPVISGFISGASILILIGQLRPLLGIDLPTASATAMLGDVLRNLGGLHPLTAAIGGAALLVLLLARRLLPRLLRAAGAAPAQAAVLGKLGPVLVVVVVTALVASMGWDQNGVRVVGALPAGLPPLGFPTMNWPLLSALLLPALIISVVGFVESVSIAGALARERGERIDADAELRGLGLANLAAGLTSAFPVTGGFSRTAVNADAGARTPLAGILTALIIAAVLLWATGLLATLPMAVLAAIIIVSVASLIDVATLRKTWSYDRADAIALLGTATGVVAFGVEAGMAIGVGLSLASLIWRSSRPHIAVVGQVPGTEHFRNVLRHDVRTRPGLVMLRVDENLFFGNAEAVADRVQDAVRQQPGTTHLVLVMSSVSHIDTTAVETLRALHDSLRAQGVALHLAEVKGPVQDRLQRNDVLPQLSGSVFLSAWDAFRSLPEPLSGGERSVGVAGPTTIPSSASD